ncbi:MAG: SDR family NAD(P)-dependent oxidoreductase [Acidobacteria bacterium]|nr:SDR family NAD(P)-dependent oxidoreductase [Acidobacteriota bacterium]
MFDQKTFVITGGTGALGSAVCKAFLQQGAKVVSSCWVEQELDRMDPWIKEHPDFKVVKANLSEEAEVEQLFDQIESPLTGLIAIAGGFAYAPLVETSLTTYKTMLDSNLTHLFLASRAALKRMDANQPGRIIGIGSFAVTHPVANMSAYRAAKAGVMNLIETIAEETLKTAITANAILPTVMDTPANRKAMPDADPSEWVSLEQVAATILWLCRPENGHITGAALPVRGRI